MQYILKDTHWEISYLDSKGEIKTFSHPLQIKNLSKFVEDGTHELIVVNQEFLEKT